MMRANRDVAVYLVKRNIAPDCEPRSDVAFNQVDRNISVPSDQVVRRIRSFVAIRHALLHEKAEIPLGSGISAGGADIARRLSGDDSLKRR